MQKNGSKKQLIFEKWDHFENWQKSLLCKGFSLWKMVSYVQKLKKCKKNTENDSRSTIKFFQAKNASKKQLIFEKCDHFENWQKWLLSKGYSIWKMVSLSQKIKFQKKNKGKHSRSTIKLFHAKNGFTKQLIFEKWDHFENWQKSLLCKGFSLWKMVSLVKKLKMQKKYRKRL